MDEVYRQLVDSLSPQGRAELQRQGAMLGIAVMRNLEWSFYPPDDLSRTKTSHIPISDCRFFVGSLTKLLTATAVLRTCEIHNLHLDAPLIDTMPSLKLKLLNDRAAFPTLRHLLSHTSGLPNWGRYTGRDDPYLYWNENLERIKLNFEPGIAMSYSNIGYSLLSLLLCEVWKAPFSDILENLVLSPLGMQETSLGHESPIAAHAPVAPYIGFSKGVPKHYHDLPFDTLFLGAGFLVTSTKDYAKLLTDLCIGSKTGDGRVFSMEMARSIALPHCACPVTRCQSYGLGVQLQTRGERLCLEHVGAIGAYQAGFILEPQSENGLVIFSNIFSRDVNIFSLIEKYAEAVLGSRPRREVITEYDSSFDGCYLGDHCGHVEIRGEGSKINVRLNGEELLGELCTDGILRFNSLVLQQFVEIYLPTQRTGEFIMVGGEPAHRVQVTWEQATGVHLERCNDWVLPGISKIAGSYVSSFQKIKVEQTYSQWWVTDLRSNVKCEGILVAPHILWSSLGVLNFENTEEANLRIGLFQYRRAM